MADITKCDGNGCPVRMICYRFTAPGNEQWQSQMASPEKKGLECEYFMPQAQELANANSKPESWQPESLNKGE